MSLIALFLLSNTLRHNALRAPKRSRTSTSVDVLCPRSLKRKHTGDGARKPDPTHPIPSDPSPTVMRAHVSDANETSSHPSLASNSAAAQVCFKRLSHVGSKSRTFTRP